MAIIGKFTKADNGFDGLIETRLWHTPARIVRIEKKSRDKAPDYRILAGRMEIGSAWSRTSKAGASYLSVTLDDPGFAAPINGRLYATADGYDLVWQRS